MYLDTRDVGFAQHIIMDGYWEYWVTQFMIEVVKPGFRVVDIGANFGYYTNLLSDLVGPDGCCLAIEPNPNTLAKLRMKFPRFRGPETFVFQESAMSKKRPPYPPEFRRQMIELVRAGPLAGRPGERV